LLRRNYKQLTKHKTDLFLNKLKDIKKIKISFFYNFFPSNPLMNEITHTKTNLDKNNKRIKSLFRQSRNDNFMVNQELDDCKYKLIGNKIVKKYVSKKEDIYYKDTLLRKHDNKPISVEPDQLPKKLANGSNTSRKNTKSDRKNTNFNNNEQSNPNVSDNKIIKLETGFNFYSNYLNFDSIFTEKTKQLNTLSNFEQNPGNNNITHNTSNNNLTQPSANSHRIIDCLAMDNFNRMYNTKHYYQNLFNHNTKASNNEFIYFFTQNSLLKNTFSTPTSKTNKSSIINLLNSTKSNLDHHRKSFKTKLILKDEFISRNKHY